MGTTLNITNVGTVNIHESPTKQPELPELEGIVNRMGPLTSLLQAIVEAENYRGFERISPYLPGLEHVSNELDKLFGDLLDLSEKTAR